MRRETAIILVTVLFVLNAVQAQDDSQRKNLSFDEYGIHLEKNRLCRQYVYRVGNEDSEGEEVRLPKGNYLLKKMGISSTDNESFDFSVDENGQLCDSAKWVVKKGIVTFYYENGIAVRSKTVFAETGITYSEIELKDSVQTAILYYRSGKVKEKETVYFNQNYAEILALYYENGNIESENNGLEQTFKVWNENGTLIRFDDMRNKTYTHYNDDGTISRVSIMNTPSRETYYHYKDGELDYYSVYYIETGKIETYDPAGKLLHDNSNDGITPVIMNIQN